MEYSCPGDLLFDPEAKWPVYPCNDASEVKCGLNPEPQPVPKPTPPPPRPNPVPHPTPYVPVPIHSTPRPFPYRSTITPRPPLPRPTPPRPQPTIIPTITTEPGTTEWYDPKKDYTCSEENKYYSLPNDCNNFIECKVNILNLNH